MTQSQGIPDFSVISEFGEGELSERLWIGGLRVEQDHYKLLRGTRALSIALRDGLDFRINDGTVEKLVNAIETCWNDPQRMRRACAPISMSTTHLSALSPSLVKIILSIDLFQTPMISCIVNKISELGEDSCPDNDVAHTLLNQLRWLDFIVDGPNLCENLLSIIPIISTSMQKELVEALPEILDDSSRNSAVTELMRLLEESPSMMGSIVDALGALGVDEERIADVNSSIISTLAATNRDMLPVTLKYILRSCPQNLLVETVNSLRSTLAIPSLGPEIGKLCLDAVTSGLRMSKPVADQVLKTLRKLENPTDHKPADLWILLALTDSPLHRKPAEILFRKKAAHNAFSRALIEAALAPFSDSFQNIADRLLSLASISVRSHETGARRTGVFLFTILFRLFPDPNVRRNVLLCLLDHTGTRRLNETDAALEALSIIARESEEDRSLLPYSALIQGLLDYLEFFRPSQIRQIWTVLGFLCRAASNSKTSGHSKHGGDAKVHEPGGESDELMGGSELATFEILLRKELTHTDTHYRTIGVIGACSMVKTLGTSVQNNILAMLFDVGRTNPFCQALVFDELAKVFAQKPNAEKETAENIRKTLSVQFERRYLKDLSETGPFVKDELLLPAELYGNLEGEDTDMCFSISFLIRNESSLPSRQDSVRSMVPNLRLLCVLTSLCFDGSLAEVDAVIGSPLHLPLLPKDQSLEDLHMQAKYDVLLSLFVAHGWIIELVNAFAEQENAELKAKCVRRIDNLLDITSQINRLISHVPNWSEVLFDSYCGTKAAISKFEENTRPSSRKRATRETRNGSTQMSSSTAEWKLLSRQLHPSAFSLIRISGPVSYRFTETNTELLREGDPVFETVSLSSAALRFLLSDLFHYLEKRVGSDLQYDSPFGTLLFRPGNYKHSRAFEPPSHQQTAAEVSFHGLKDLKVALTSLGKQLKRSLTRMFPEDGDEILDDLDSSSLDLDKTCAILCLKCIAMCLNSRIMSETSSQEMLFDVLASIRLDDEPAIESSDPLTDADIHAAAKVAFQQLQSGLSSVLNFSGNDEPEDHDLRKASLLGFEGCCDFLSAMESAFSHCSARAKEELGNVYSQIALALIENQWNPSTVRAKKVQRLIPGIVKIHVQRSRDPLKVLEALRDEVLSFSENERKSSTDKGTSQQNSQAQSNRICSLTEQTFFAFTISILEQYILLFKKFQPDDFDKAEDALNKMIRFIKAELPLYSLARKNQTLLGPIMRTGRTLVDLFLKTFLPFLKDRFRDHRATVIQICKIHQKPTRLLQTLCAHCKFIRDTSLTNLVPSLRKSLELVLYGVKELLQANNAKNAFQLGNLKHRDINGEVLSSQHLQYKSESEKSEYSSLAVTDDDGDEMGSNCNGPNGNDIQDDAPEALLRKARKGRRPKSASGKVLKKRKVSISQDKRKETASELDLGSDVEKENHKNEEETQEITRAPNRKLSKRSDNMNKDEDVGGEVLAKIKRKRKKKITVIDDEVDGDDDDGEQNEEEGEKVLEMVKRKRKKKVTVIDDDADDDNDDDEQNEEEGEKVLAKVKRKRKKKITVIDDEADADDDDEEQNEEEGEEEDLLSQFLVFDDEEEEEAAES